MPLEVAARQTYHHLSLESGVCYESHSSVGWQSGASTQGEGGWLKREPPYKSGRCPRTLQMPWNMVDSSSAASQAWEWSHLMCTEHKILGHCSVWEKG